MLDASVYQGMSPEAIDSVHGLFFDSGRHSAYIYSRTGVHQGAPLSGALFSIGTIAALKEAAAAYPSTNLRAYLDDLRAIGPVADVCSAQKDIRRKLTLVSV